MAQGASGVRKSGIPDNNLPALSQFRFSIHEVGGALGDLGTLLPLAIALITVNHMSATGVFLVAGVAYVTAGVLYSLPLPVSPLQGVAPIANPTGASPHT